ncbi:unnamed protein product [Rotaria sp. Silwood2]|nr:unnamed protein product [Rotaria sp. Silwood2]CAF4473567.1 unnamed protein product [Rotaria sp. Silwood2]
MCLRGKVLKYRDKRKKLITDIENDENEETLVEQIRTLLNIKSTSFIKTDYYRVCKQAHLEGIVKKFGLKLEKLGENLHENYKKKNEIDQNPIESLATCKEFICKQFPNT